MGSIVDAEFRFAKEKHARWAAHVVENHIKLSYAPFPGFDVNPKELEMSLSDLLFEYDEALSACDPLMLPRDNALTRMRRDRTRLILDRCTDVQWMVHLGPWEPDDFFTQTCFSLVRRFPQVRFVAYTRYEMTVSGAVQRTRASWNGEHLQFRQISGMRPLDESCWDTWSVYDWVPVDGRLVQCENVSSALQQHYFALLADAQESSEAGDARAALRFIDDASALPACAERLEALLCRADVGRRLRRRGVRTFIRLWDTDKPTDTEDMSRIELTEMPLDVGSHVLRRDGSVLRDVDTVGGRVHAEVSVFGTQGLYLIGGQYLLDEQEGQDKWYLVDWEYEL